MVKSTPQLIGRLKRIEGQVRGVTRMIEEERYCIDVLNQILAIKAALGKVEQEVLKGHAANCLTQAVQSGDKQDQAKKFAELIELIGRHR